LCCSDLGPRLRAHLHRPLDFPPPGHPWKLGTIDLVFRLASKVCRSTISILPQQMPYSTLFGAPYSIHWGANAQTSSASHEQRGCHRLDSAVVIEISSS
jgi:hypothetical protein